MKRKIAAAIIALFTLAGLAAAGTAFASAGHVTASSDTHFWGLEG